MSIQEQQNLAPVKNDTEQYQTDMSLILYMLPQRERGRWFSQDPDVDGIGFSDTEKESLPLQ